MCMLIACPLFIVGTSYKEGLNGLHPLETKLWISIWGWQLYGGKIRKMLLNFTNVRMRFLKWMDITEMGQVDQIFLFRRQFVRLYDTSNTWHLNINHPLQDLRGKVQISYIFKLQSLNCIRAITRPRAILTVDNMMISWDIMHFDVYQLPTTIS